MCSKYSKARITLTDKMWSSSDDSGSDASQPKKPVSNPPKCATKPVTSREASKPLTAQFNSQKSHSTVSRQYTFLRDNVDSSLDSDSSGEQGSSIQHGPAKARAGESKPQPEEVKVSKTSMQEAASGKQSCIRRGAPYKGSPKMTTQAKKTPMKAAGIGRPPAQDQTAVNYYMDFPGLSSDDFPALGASGLPSKKMAIPKHALTPQVRVATANFGGVSTSSARFERHQVKASDTDRGQWYSKLEEKLSLSDFIPKNRQNKEKKKRGKQPQCNASSATDFPDSFLHTSRGAGSKAESSVHPGPSSALKNAVGKSQDGGGGKKPKSVQSMSRKQDGDGSAPESDDDSLSMILFSTAPAFVPPHKHRAEDPVVFAEEQEQTVPKQPAGSGLPQRRQQHDDNPPPSFFAERGGEGSSQRRREGVHSCEDGSMRRDRERGGSDWRNNDNPRQRGQRDNWNPREPRHDDANRRQNPQDHQIPQEAVRGHHGLPHDDDNYGGPRGPPRHYVPPQNPGGHRQQPRAPQPADLRPLESNLSFGKLRDLRTKTPAEVVAALSNSKEGLIKLLNNRDKLGSDAPFLINLLSALAKAADCGSMPAQRGEILNQVRTSPFLQVLGTHLATAAVMGQKVEAMTVIGDSTVLLRSLLHIFPSSFTDIVMVSGCIDMALQQLKMKGDGDLEVDVAKKMADLAVSKAAAAEELRQKEWKKSGRVDEDAQNPPEDFRVISVFPTMDDLKKDHLPFLRKNKEVGGYTNLDHYLDIQFRLLREDFVYPLREGIAEYLTVIANPQKGRKLKDIRVYHDVHIIRAVCLQSGLGHRLTFDISRGLKHVRWEVSKRLIFGSLVCLSADNFQTLLFATVAKREASDLREGIVDVIFEHDVQEVSAIPPETMFTMAETTAFFEAYRHVLSGLQQFQENQLPFEKYIVRCEKMVSEPSYLVENKNRRRTVHYDLRPLVDDMVKLRDDRNLADHRRNVFYDFSDKSQPAAEVPILSREDWPDPSLLNLDSSQFEALQRALTREFSIIQGPPGTGKTYVGLKIAKALLHNRTCWDPDNNSCMLIVCFTNHALDQFLEGIVSFFNGKVVRVGSRLRSEMLEAYSLSNLRWNMRRQREGQDRDFRDITRLRFQGHGAMDALKREIDTMGVKIESAKREILHEDILSPYMLDRHYDRMLDARNYVENQALYHRGKTKKRVFCMPEWLGISAVLQEASHQTLEHLHLLEQELGEGGEDEEVEIEGEVQAMEDQHRLDTDSIVPDSNDKKRKEKEKKKALAHERSTYLAVDISQLDRDMGGDSNSKDSQQQQRQQGGGGGGGFQIPRSQWRKIKRRLRRNVEIDDRMTEQEERQVQDIWLLDIPQRWRLYRRWTQNLCQALKDEMTERERIYADLAKRQQETLMQEDKYILRTATVIAMTTTAAARYQSVLQEIKPKIIVVEEAAEVLEGHVITTLSTNCQHLILIGDHKQLRPSPTVYALARKYNLELSLFERMINNGLKCITLGWQHRMRPEISSLIQPIYPQLQNHVSVEGYENVAGVCNNVFFITHGYPEDHDEETKSHSNAYEAQYLAALCLYLLKQGYHPSRITILTTYSGQLSQLRRLMPKKSPFDGVRVTVVDNFQGEENDIILLSLVRSNEDNSVGFLKIENRVCVALSRAKMGLYVIGNFDLLAGESKLWQSITMKLQRSNQLGETLHLYCQNHPGDDRLAIQHPQDFNKAPEGGCMKPCTTRLNCGHVCMRMCHPYDQDHLEYQCPKRCERKMKCGHSCRKQCFQDCGECSVLIQRTMAKCGHSQWIACSLNPDDFICQEECKVTLICGHKCGDVCGERHSCYEKVNHTWPCGHEGTVYCKDKDSTLCSHPCEQQLSCGHGCSGTCCECYAGRLHRQCKNHCTRILVCGHACRDTCSSCPPCSHKCENSCVHSSCLKRCGLPCPPCNEPCAWQCPHHRCGKLCHEPCDRPQCNKPCHRLLKCQHPCIGLCGELCPHLCRVCDVVEVTDIFFGSEDDPNARYVELEDCHHVFEVEGLDQWMITPTDTHNNAVHLKACPRCKTPIRRNLRYSSIIKMQLKDIETIKKRMQGDLGKRREALDDLHRMVEEEPDPVYESMKHDLLENGNKDSLAALVALKNQMEFLDMTHTLKLEIKKKSLMSFVLQDDLEKFEKWLLRTREVFSEQELADAQAELKRLQHFFALLSYKEVAAKRGITLHPKVMDPVNTILERMKRGYPHSDLYVEMTNDLLNQLKELVPETCLGISDSERVMIVKAMGLSQGHWFKCPQGHIYAIADCGGATIESRCPDCNSTIGGTQHRVREDNTLASEMDGATRPAWPNAVEDIEQDLNDLNL